MSRDLRDLLADSVDGPTRPLNLDDLAAGARRRGRVRRASAVGGVLAVLFAAVLVPTALDRDIGPMPQIVDRLDGTASEPAVDTPAGWVTVTAGELAISVPPAWDVDVREMPEDPPPNHGEGGPCSYDLVPGVLSDDPGVSRAVVYDGPSSGVCNAIGHGPPDRPGLVLYTTIRGEVDGEADQLGAERNGLEGNAVRERVGAVEVWRSVPRPGEADANDIETYVAAELIGGLWVAMPDHPEMQRILATLRPAEGAVPRVLPLTTSYRDLEPDEWQPLASPPSPTYIAGHAPLRTEADLDEFWRRLQRDESAPTLPAGTEAIAAATYAGGLPGGCHQLREVVGVRVSGVSGTILLGDLAAGWGEDDCSDEAFVHVVAVPPDVAVQLDVVGTVLIDDWAGEGAAAEHAERPARLNAVDVHALAAAATDDPSLKGHVVVDDDSMASVWDMAGVAGDPPSLPDGTIGLFAIARETPGACRSLDDVLGVEIREGSLAVMLLDPRAQSARSCSGQEGAHAFTAYAVAIPEAYADRLSGADVAVLDDVDPHG